jgi:hypothetical protein
MNYIGSITDYFKSPKWVMNLLLTGVCMLIPVVGPMVVMGWLISGFWMTKPVSFEAFPIFDFGKFGAYLERGLWPFLVTLAAGAGLGIVVLIVGIIPSAILGFVFGHGHGFLPFIGGSISSLIWTVLMAAIVFALIPLLIRSILVQDFVKSFDIPFVKRFVTMMWKEMLFSAIFGWVAGMVLSMVGLLAFCVGVYAAIALAYFMWMHLYWQLYAMYLQRGGEPVPVSPKLSGEATVEIMPPTA